MKKNRTKLLALVLALALVLSLGLTACGQSAPKEDAADPGASGDTEAAKSDPIRVGTMPIYLGLPIKYAYDNGFYEEAGLNVELFLFPTGAPINEALAAEQLDLAGSGMASVFALASGDCYYLGECAKLDGSKAGGVGIYVRGDSPVLQKKGLVEGKPEVYGSAEDIKDMTILGAVGTSDQYMAITWAEMFGLTPDDFTLLNIERGPAVQAFKTGEGDAIATGGPPFSTELEEAGCVMVGSIEEISDVPQWDAMIGRKEFIDGHEEEVKKFIEATYKAAEMLNDPELHREAGLKYYNENGQDYTDEMMDLDVKYRQYMNHDILFADDYRFAAVMLAMGDLYMDIGKIEPDLKDNIYSSLRPDFINDIYGLDVKTFEVK